MSKSNSGEFAAIKKDEFDPIKNFQPMPKRFMVWDTLHEDWREWKTAGDEKWNNIFELHQLSIFLVNASNNGLPHTRFKICQSTNFYAKSRQEVFEGSILHTDKEGNGYVYMEDNGKWRVLFRNETHLLFDILYAPSCELVGHILSNPELLKEKE